MTERKPEQSNYVKGLPRMRDPRDYVRSNVSPLMAAADIRTSFDPPDSLRKEEGVQRRNKSPIPRSRRVNPEVQ